jgi:integrase
MLLIIQASPIRLLHTFCRPFDKALNTASIKIVTRCLLEWQLHTMVRPGEAASTRWDEIDF